MNDLHAPSHYGRAFALGVALNVIYVALEAGFGFWTDSLALLSDAGHNLSDVFGLLLAWAGHTLARVAPSRRRTYGWRGSTILAALFNALILMVAIGGIAWEAARRFANPVIELPGMTIVAVAAVGVAVNTATALLFLRGRKHDLNLRGAFLHMAADAGVSAGVVAAGLGVYCFGFAWIDPVTSLVIVGVIFVGTWGLLKESVNLAIQAVPEHIDPVEVAAYLAELDGVAEIHDLHIWALSTTEVSLTAHLVKPEAANEDDFLCRLKADLHNRFGIGHVTVQIERGGGSMCAQAPQHRV
jgi:cobalt-zinc-cadmium efflux system protein